MSYLKYIFVVWGKIKEIAVLSYKLWLGEPLTEKQIMLNQYLLAKRLLELPLTEEDYQLDPLGDDHDKFLEIMSKVSKLEQLPYSYKHIYLGYTAEDLQSNYSLGKIMWNICNAPVTIIKDIGKSIIATENLEPGKKEVLVEGQFVLMVHRWFNYFYYKAYNKYKLGDNDIGGPLPTIDHFTHDGGITYHSKTLDPFKVNSYNEVDYNKVNYYTKEWYNKSRLITTESDVNPFYHLNDYYTTYNYYLYRNAGLKYLDYSHKSHQLSNIEKMLCYNSNILYQEYISNRLRFDWESINLKLFNINYADSFINPLYNFITNHSYVRYRHNRADPLIYSANLFRSKRRFAHHKGFFPNRPRLRDIMIQKQIKFKLDSVKVAANANPKFKRNRTSSLRQSVLHKRAQNSRVLHDSVEHRSVDYNSKYPLFYDFLSYYQNNGHINPLSRLAFNSHLQKVSSSISDDFNPPYQVRLGSRLARKLGYVERRLESDNSSVYAVYINHLQNYLKSEPVLTQSSFGSVDLLYDSLLSQLGKNQINSLLDSYFFRSNYLSDLYHRFNFTSITGRSGNNLIRKNIATRGRYSMTSSPWYSENHFTNIHVKLTQYDILTRFKLELLSSTGFGFSRVSQVFDTFNPTSIDLLYLFSSKMSQFNSFDALSFIFSSFTLLGMTIFNFYNNFEPVLLSLFNNTTLYPWMNPIVKTAQSFWYGRQFFYFNFESLDFFYNNSNFRVMLDMDNILNSPFEQLKDNLGQLLELSSSTFTPESYVYGSNYFFNSQYSYYIYQAKNVVKLPQYSIDNSSIVYFQWDNMPLLNLMSHSYSLNLFRIFEQFTYHLFTYDMSHLCLLLAKDITFNFIYTFDKSILDFCFFTVLEVLSTVVYYSTMAFNYLISTFSIWFLFFLFKWNLYNSIESFYILTSNLIFLNIRHLFIDLPYWYFVDFVTSIMFHWHYWLLGVSSIFYVSNWLPTWYIYSFFDSYLKFYLLDYYYYYYSECYRQGSSLGNIIYSSYCLFVYWVFLVPLYYLIRFIGISIMIESYGLFFIITAYVLFYINTLNNSKRYAWFYKGSHNYSIRDWVRRYQVTHDMFINSYVPYLDQLRPYLNRSFTTPKQLTSRLSMSNRLNLNSINIYREPQISGYRKYPSWQYNYYNSPDIFNYLFNAASSPSPSSSLLDNMKSSKSEFYMQYMLSKEYLDLQSNLQQGYTKFPLFRAYPIHVQSYYRKAIYSFHSTGFVNHLFKSNVDFITPFILLGKHYEDQNMNACLDAMTTDLVQDFSDLAMNENPNSKLRFYYLNKYFPFYARFLKSNNRVRSISSSYLSNLDEDGLGYSTSESTINYKYVVWDGGSHTIFLMPGVVSLMDEIVQDTLHNDPAVYKKNLHRYLYQSAENQVPFEDWMTDGSLPESSNDLNLGLQYSEQILFGAVDLITAIERQRRIIYSLYCFHPGYTRFYPESALNKYSFKHKKYSRRLKEDVYMTDLETDAIDSIHHFFYSKGRFKTKLSETSPPYYNQVFTRYRWSQYKTNLLWYVKSLREGKFVSQESWYRDFDLAGALSQYNYEYNLLSLNFLYPLFYYNSLGNDYQYSYAWYKLHKLHNLNSHYKNHSLISWELSKSWEIDMGVVDNTEINDSPYNVSLTNTLSEIFDGSINGKLIPSYNKYCDSYTYRAMLSHPANPSYHYLASRYYHNMLTRKVIMGKYYRYLHYKNAAVDMQRVAMETGEPFKLNFKLHPQNFYFNFHYLGLKGRADFQLERLVYDFDTGWVKFFNLISYKKYRDHRASADSHYRRLHAQSTRVNLLEESIKQLSYLDSFANTSIYNSFFTEFNELGSSIYYSWITQQSFSNLSSDSFTYNYLDSHKYSYLLGGTSLLDKYGYDQYGKIKDMLRDTHNYIRFQESNDNYPISLKSIENFYEYDRYSMTPYHLDTRWDDVLYEGRTQSKRGTGHKMFHHFRSTGPRQFQSSKAELYKSYHFSYFKQAPSIDVVFRRPGEIVDRREAYLDLFKQRKVRELNDHLINSLNINFDLVSLQLKPILFYKVPNYLSGKWVDYQKTVNYYDWFDHPILNDLKQHHIGRGIGSWKYQYLRDLLTTEEYNYIFEDNLKNRVDNSFNYTLLERYCEQEITGALLTKRYLIYREKVKSISPNASLFFLDYYPEYIWEYYDFSLYEEFRNDWFFIIPLFGLFFVYYMSTPNDYYKFSRKRFKRTLYVHHINRRRRSGPKNAHRRIFAIPNRLKRKRLEFYRIQSKNKIIMSKVTNKRNTLRSREYLYPYRIVNPIRYNYTSLSNSKSRSRILRSKRLAVPRKFIFYDGYTIQLRMNRRRSRRFFRRRLQGLNKETVYSNMRLMRGVDPYYTFKLKNEDFDSYLKIWKRRRTPKGQRKYQRLSNPYKRPYRRPYRRFYSFDFYRVMLHNDLLKIWLYFKSFFSIFLGSIKIIMIHFIKYPSNYSEFKYTLAFVWSNKFELIPGLEYIKNHLFIRLIPRLLKNILYLTSNSNPYNRPFGLENKKKIRRYWRGKRRHYRDKLSVYNALYAVFFNYLVFPVYIHIIKPIYRAVSFVTTMEKQVLHNLTSKSVISSFWVRCIVIQRLLTSTVSLHSQSIYSKLIASFFSITYFLWTTIINLIHVTFNGIFILFKPVLFVFIYINCRIFYFISIFMKPIVTLFSSLKYFFSVFLYPFKFIMAMSFMSMYIALRYIFILLINFISIFLYIIYKPLYLFIKFIFFTEFKLLYVFYNFYFEQITIILLKFKKFVQALSHIQYFSHLIYLKLPFHYLFSIFISPFFSFIKFIILYSMNLVFTSIAYSIFFYIEPFIYHISSLYYYLNYYVKLYNSSIFKYLYYLYGKLVYAVNVQFVPNIIYSFMSGLYASIWYFISPIVFHVFKLLSIFIRAFLNSYLYFYVLVLLLLLVMNSFLLNISIILITTASFVKLISSFIIYYSILLFGFSAYFSYFILSPFIYLILVLLKSLCFIPLVMVKLIMVYFCSFVYLILNIYHCYAGYIIDGDMSFVSFLNSLYQTCLLDSFNYTFQIVYSYLKHIVSFILRHYIINDINDVICYYDYYINRASYEGYYSYLTIKRR